MLLFKALGLKQCALRAMHTNLSIPARMSKSFSTRLSSSNLQYVTLQSIIEEEHLDYLILPTADFHMSEYISDEFKLIEKVCNFSGSSSTLLLSKNTSPSKKCGHLFVDGRYHVQADKEVDSSFWNVVKLGLDNTPPLSDFIDKLDVSRSNTNSGGELVVGIDSFLHSIEYVKRLQQYYSINKNKKRNFTIKCLSKSSLIRKLNNSKGNIYIHPLEYAGLSLNEKVAAVRDELQLLSSNNVKNSNGKPLSGLLISALDEIAWILNLRGKDIDYNPVFLSYCIITMAEVHLFVDKAKLSNEVTEYLRNNDVIIHSYDVNHIAQVIKKSFDRNSQIVLDQKSTSYGLYDLIKSAIHSNSSSDSSSSDSNNGTYLINNSIVSLLKSIKNKNEIAGMKSAHLRDAAAIIEFLAHLDKLFKDNKNFRISEVEIDKMLQEKRKTVSKSMYITDSFATISAVGKNAAIVHYRANENENDQTPFYLERNDDASEEFKTDSLLLLDSGAQYIDGTTDVTRTISVGNISTHKNSALVNTIKDNYTRVLKGFLAVDQSILPLKNISNTQKQDYYQSRGSISDNCGFVLDVLARQYLLKVSRNYLHGTGHGVGASLNVHESPISINGNNNASFVHNKIAIVPGNIFSNEPGYYNYEDGYGIRIENLLLAVASEFPDKNFIRFERLTHVPIQRDLIDLEMLSKEEKHALNKYHEEVFDRVLPLLITDEAKKWIQTATSPIMM